MDIKKINNLEIKNKKGIFFTIIAITLLSLFLLSLTIFTENQERKTINKRIETMNNYISSLEEDLPRKLYISGFRIIFLYEKRILESGSFIQNLDLTFNETFFDGTIDGTITEEETSILRGVKFQDIQDDLNNKADKINLDITLSNPEISINQSDPWNILITLKGDLLISDEGNLASWNRKEIVTTLIPIENFEDPLYLIKTNGLIAHKVRKTPYTQFTNGNDVTNLKNHLFSSYYISSTEAPSFIDRLGGKTSPNPQGIESLVNLQALASQGISTLDKTVVDHIYFTEENPSKNNIQGMDSWFKLDSAHFDKYNVSHLVV